MTSHHLFTLTVGSCPVAGLGSVGSCRDTCRTDWDCPGGRLCCPKRCWNWAAVCKDPVLPATEAPPESPPGGDDTTRNDGENTTRILEIVLPTVLIPVTAIAITIIAVCFKRPDNAVTPIVVAVPCRPVLLTAETGTFSSPNYPENYPNNQRCLYEIIVQRNQRILLTFSDFNVERDLDFVEVYDGIDQSRGGERYTGQTNVHLIESTGNAMTVVFTSDRAGTASGFNASYITLESGCQPVLLTGESGTFSSPDYPDNYPSNQTCRYDIVVESDKRIQLTFSVFDLERSSDFLDIYDGNSTDRQNRIGVRNTGLLNLGTIYSSANTMTAVFTSDATGTAAGFSATYTAVDIGCPSRAFMKDSGRLHSPFYPAPYPNEDRCRYRIKVDFNKAVQLAFVDFTLEDGYDYVEVFQGDTTNRRYTGSSNPGMLTSSSHFMNILFTSDHSIAKRGFNATYTSVDKVFTTCTIGQFRCADGVTCIRSWQRCNGEVDCSDRSDERQCG
ncbi:deleted in malignant brain tumors 1 protein-like [Branchiostoma floridae]|uniref:Deleted in malignant brain tumors 1 protein-like n=1 Tax=Branchiostoma floridae TaxID=7739 RepID=A0A9J7LZ18_BRAFL|nr:deleted in malignant brain tumors 1 protein-like [Branchiostoma floridae]